MSQGQRRGHRHAEGGAQASIPIRRARQNARGRASMRSRLLRQARSATTRNGPRAFRPHATRA